MRKMLFESDEETLKITENTQPAILAASVACAQPLLEAGIVPDFVGIKFSRICGPCNFGHHGV